MSNRHPFALLALAVVAAHDVAAATFTVSRLDDPAPGSCTPGDCSLREAVAAANAAPGQDVIALPVGTLTFGSGEIAISGDVAIEGSGAATTTLYNTLPKLLRVDGATLVLADVTIGGPSLARFAGDAIDPASVHGNVPIAIDAHDDAGVTLHDVHIPIAGGLVQLSGGTQTDLDVNGSDVDALTVSQTDGQVSVVDSTIAQLNLQGGDLDLRLLGSRVRGDTEPPIGGGISMTTSGEVRIADTGFDGATQGIVVQGTAPALLDIQRIDVHADSGPLYVLTPAALSLSDSTFRDNTAVGGAPGAVHLSVGANATIRGCTFSNNKGSGDTGGALLVEAGAHALIVNSTFSGNSFTVAAASAGARGAAIGVRGSASEPSLVLNHVTVVAPEFFPVGVQGTAIGVRGAADASSINVHNTILRGGCRFESVLGGSFGLSVGNIESPNDSCGLDTGTNQVEVSAAALAIGAPGDHGGRTPTYLPGPASVAVGAAEAAACLGDDQRHYLRPLQDGCDVGAVEVDGIDRIFTDGLDG